MSTVHMGDGDNDGGARPLPLHNSETRLEGASLLRRNTPFAHAREIDLDTVASGAHHHIQAHQQQHLRKQDVELGEGAFTLDGALTHIGLGWFHIRLIIVCGCGWAADNMWIQVVSTTMPRLQQEYNTSSLETSLLGSAIFAGMCVGSLVWGGASDKIGRRAAFTITLLVAALFGAINAAAVMFLMSLATISMVGFGVGGNMPVDGALFVEFMPKESRGRLMVLLSMFWVIGSIVASGIAWAVIPRWSCDVDLTDDECTWRMNYGWRVLSLSVAVINGLMFFGRIGMPESPAYEFHKGRVTEAENILRHVANTNDKQLPFDFHLVEDNDTDDTDGAHHGDGDDSFGVAGGYGTGADGNGEVMTNVPSGGGDGGGGPNGNWEDSARLSDPTMDGGNPGWSILLSKKYMYTSVCLWVVWFCANFGFTMFNLFLPSLFEAKGVVVLDDVYRNSFIYSLSGIPGSLLGAVMVESCFGRKWTMVISTIVSSAMMLLFILGNTELDMIIFTSLVSFSSQIMYAGLYTYTPEVYETSIRTTGVGVCTALGRAAGILAPLVSGATLDYDKAGTLTLVVAMGNMVVAALGMCMLRKETRGMKLQ